MLRESPGEAQQPILSLLSQEITANLQSAQATLQQFIRGRMANNWPQLNDVDFVQMRQAKSQFVVPVEMVELILADHHISILVCGPEEVHDLIFGCQMFVVLGAGVEIIQHDFYLSLVQEVIVVGIILIEELEDQVSDLVLTLWMRLLFFFLFLRKLFLSAWEGVWPDILGGFGDWLGLVARMVQRSGAATHFITFIQIVNHFKFITYNKTLCSKSSRKRSQQQNDCLIFTDHGKHTLADIQFSKMGGAFLSQPVTEKMVKRYQHGKIRVVSCEMQGWRKYMEDAVLFHRISKEIFLFAVFDGHGGMEVSQLCAKKIIELLQGNRSFKSGDYVKALEETFKELDEFLGSEHGEEILKNTTIENGLQPFENSRVADSVGCTANVILLVGKTLYVANAGDSRAALSRLGSLIELSYDHKPQDPIQLERIVSSGAKVEAGRINNHLNLSRCLGDLFYKKSANLPYQRQTITGHPDVKTIQLCKEDDFIVIGCDGIWQRYQKNSQDLITLIRQQRLKGKTPQQVLTEMLDGFLAKDPSKQQLGCDNMSVILIQLNKNAF